MKNATRNQSGAGATAPNQSAVPVRSPTAGAVSGSGAPPARGPKDLPRLQPVRPKAQRRDPVREEKENLQLLNLRQEQIDKKVAAEKQTSDARFRSLEETVDTLLAAIQSGSPEGGEEQLRGMKLDSLWCCDKCNARLGIFDVETDELRILSTKQVIYIKAVPGGEISQNCRRCGWMNTAKDDRPIVTEVEGEE